MLPTRDRAESLRRTLAALSAQSRRPDEVIVVDASDPPLAADALGSAARSLPLALVHAGPGVCAQRNLGVARTAATHVLLLDDDLEPPPAYVERLADYLDAERDQGAATGIWTEVGDVGTDARARELVPPTARLLLFSFLFQQSVWADVEGTEVSGLSALVLPAVKRWYRRRGNRWSLGGWPLVTQARGSVFQTAIYSLGAALVRRDWLLRSPYDERLGPRGMGDNYGVALGFPGEQPIAVLTDLPILHRREPGGRLAPAEAYYERILALDHFLRSSARFPRSSRGWLAWSLLGNALRFGLQRNGPFLGRTWDALRVVVGAANPLTSSMDSPERIAAS